ncbi:transcription elongation factor B polypeptide 3 isoform X2 [Bacillus rossius redtenbacheri]|uniref:transcription elongation factor B polypeptide 3 isoform X2 n=1 Tax=Bacillus rossius redtenbacheri TaxID=93214 RepID=UPI002FDDE1B5
MSVVDAIKHYQRSLEKCSNDSSRILHCIYKLYKLPITVQHLQETGVGRTVNSLRKFDGDTGEAAKALVTKWKSMVMDEDSCGDENEAEDEDEAKSPEQSSDDSSRHRKRSDERRRDKSSSEHKRDHKRKSESNSYSSKKKTKDKIKVEEEEEEEESEQEENDSRVRDSPSAQADERMNNRRIKEEIDDEIRRVAEEDYRGMGDAGVEDSGGENSSRLQIAESENEDSDMLHVEETASAEESVSRRRGGKGESSSHHRSKSGSDSHHGSSKKHKDKHKERHKDKSREKEKRSSVEKTRRQEVDSSSNDKPSASDAKVKEPLPVEEKKKLKQDAGSSSSKKVESRHVSADKMSSKDELNSKPKKIKKEMHSSSKKSKKAVEKTADGSIDCYSGASFAEALGMVDPFPVLKKSRMSSPTVRQETSSSKKSVSSSAEVNSTSSKPQSSSSKSSALKGVDWLSPDAKLEPLERQMQVEVDSDADVDSTLSEINPNYRPLPFIPLDSPPHKKSRMLTEEEALSQVMSTKNQRTKVYSGLKASKGMLKVPSLLELCTRVLVENIDAMEYTGGVPFELLEPVLKHASPQQLFTFEHYNPYLIGDTNELWTFHVNKEFRSKQHLEFETSRDMYIRCVEEREEKLKALTSNIQQSIAKSTPVRQTKLAYVDSVAKPPRSIARKQAKYGTASAVSTSSPGKSPRPVGFSQSAASLSPSTSHAPVAVPPPTPPRVPVAKVKPRVAPLMQKTMKLVKSLKR